MPDIKQSTDLKVKTGSMLKIFLILNFLVVKKVASISTNVPIEKEENFLLLKNLSNLLDDFNAYF